MLFVSPIVADTIEIINITVNTTASTLLGNIIVNENNFNLEEQNQDIKLILTFFLTNDSKNE